MIRRDQGEIRDRNDSPPRITLGMTEGVKLLEIYIVDTGLLTQFAKSSFCEIFFRQNKTARNSQLILERRDPALYKQHLERAFLNRENDNIDSDFHLLFR